MLEFKSYVERRQRCQAFQVLSAADVEIVALTLGAIAYELHGNRDTFHVDLTFDVGDPEVVKMGDWIVREDCFTRGRVVHPGQFLAEWEERK